MTGRWLTVSKTIHRIYNEAGRLYTADDVLRLGRRNGAWGLVVEETHYHTRVSEQSVDDHVAWLNAAEKAGPSVGGGPELPAFIEDEYRRRKSDDDTPNDEGDNA